MAMESNLQTTQKAAQWLGISKATFYDWLAQSDAGTLVIRGQPVTIDYYQGGPRGQGRIKIETAEIERLRELMRVRPNFRSQRRPPRRAGHYPGIYVELGDPG